MRAGSPYRRGHGPARQHRDHALLEAGQRRRPEQLQQHPLGAARLSAVIT
ncbi:hypothetical protein HK414_27455 [Ramlibacter terrae]|uniref:Uncharacterized protein n=1 Tax=Ramlibacter terrae TaxID=2732511 RepID=A0ABX6P6C6_9BURK|nr:hypothetical protein HK414_27455 [Ramlibacter terrae]